MCHPEFVLQQPFLALHAARVAHQTLICAYHPMTGNDDGYLVLSICAGRRPYHLGVTQPLCQVHIADCLAKRHLQQFIPHILLKLGAFLMDGDIEGLPSPLKKLYQLLGTLMKHLAHPRYPMCQLLLAVHKTKLGDIAFRTSNLHKPHGALVICIVVLLH